ncbi:hypothetical protein ACRDNQ_04010 [Palleronia sp. KMU-117]|uniref:hypothetical protein n=1 Tax=Palleronia sp. KMU-117 TaxID=3434108 RepID=UPI003D7050C5
MKTGRDILTYMAKKDIQSRTDAVTKDMTAEPEKRERVYSFPKFGVSIKATSYQEALEKLKASK